MDAKRKRAESREGMRVTTVALPEDLHCKLSIAALEGRTVMTELVRQAVTEWLERRDKATRTKRGRK